VSVEGITPRGSLARTMSGTLAVLLVEVAVLVGLAVIVTFVVVSIRGARRAALDRVAMRPAPPDTDPDET
jgi:hypothetical protein